MQNHLSDIGFHTNNREEFNQLCHEIVNQGRKLETKDGFYFMLEVNPRIELWICMPFDKSKPNGFNPYFKGDISNKILIEGVEESQYSRMENAYEVWINRDTEFQEYPFLFDCVNFSMSGGTIDKYVNANVTAFADEVELYENEDEFESKYPREKYFLSHHSFVPTGQFVKEGFNRNAHVMFNGDVRKIEELTNSKTGKSFYWAIIGTMDNEYDVVIDPSFFNRKPVIGNIIHGDYWMSGKLYE
jgi:hypothetical protein